MTPLKIGDKFKVDGSYYLPTDKIFECKKILGHQIWAFFMEDRMQWIDINRCIKVEEESIIL